MMINTKHTLRHPMSKRDGAPNQGDESVHGSQNRLWQVIQPREQKEGRQKYETRTNQAGHLGSRPHISIDP